MDLDTLFARYRPYLAVVVAIAALVFLLPDDGDDSEVAAGFTPVTTAVPGTSQDPLAPGATTTVPIGDDGQPTDVGTDPAGPSDANGPSNPSSPTATTVPVNNTVPASTNALDNPDCDPATGRIRVPTAFAPPCVPVFTGDNGGATAQGVTADTIKVVVFQAESDPAVDAALTAAGANNTPEEQEATMRAYVDYFNHHFETYGRQVELVYRQGSGDSGDDAVGRADALAIATEDKPFAVFGAPTAQSFVDELAARKILCICTTSQPQEFYESHAPYIGYTSLMSSTQGYIHRAEYVGKRLAGRNAAHAGTRDGVPMNLEPRTFGLLWYETEDNAYAAGVAFFEEHLKEAYGVELAESLAYCCELSEVAERARPLIQRLKAAGVNSLIFSGDPITPAIFTQEATRQAYFPEWIVTGSALTDTNLFARTFDQQQWQRAFGISYLTVQQPEDYGADYRTHVWHTGETPVAANQYGVIYPTPRTFFTGVHLAGPNLTVESWQAGLFSYPVSGRGFVTAPTWSFGNHGLWPFTDYTNYDDITEIWWDPNALGEDEVGNFGRGMYRYVNGGTRYLPGEQPTSDPVVFTSPETAPTGYDSPPPGEEHPDYPHEDHD